MSPSCITFLRNPPQHLLRPRVPSPQPAAKNLRRYLKNAAMPSIARHDRSFPYSLPQKGRRSHRNKLRVRRDPDRHIDQIHVHEPKAFDNATKKYHKYYVYGRRGRPFAGNHYQNRPGEALVLPAAGWRPECSPYNTPYPTNIEQTCDWLASKPFQTMQRAMHLAYPDTTRWWLEEACPMELPEEVANRVLWRTYVWRFHPDEYHATWWRDVAGVDSAEWRGVSGETEPAPVNSMVLVVQPPWILALQDMKNFTKCTNLPSLPDDETPPESQLNSSHRVWANLLDTCKRHECHSFVLTTYEGWIFGSFSENWASANVSELKGFDATEPRVMQILVYWVACSMKLAGAELPVETVERENADVDKQ